MKRLFINLPIIIIFLAIMVTFLGLQKTFYQQDEWQGLGHMIVESARQHLTGGLTPLQIFFGEGRVLTRLISLPLFGITKFNVIPLAIFSLGVHFLNAALVFFLAKRMLADRLAALIAALFFSLNSVSHQPVTWFGTSTGTLPAATFVFLALLFYLFYLKNGKKTFLYFSFLSTIVSILFKEVGLFLFIFLPFTYLIFKKGNIIEAARTHLILLAYGSGLILFRALELSSQQGKIGVFVSSGESFLQTILLRSILYPLSGLSQIFIPPLILSSWADKITKIQYPFLADNPLIGLISQTITADLISIFFSAGLLLVLFALFIKSKGFSTVLFSVGLVLASFLPYIVLDRSFSYLESRYYYIASAGGGIILALIMKRAFKKSNVFVAASLLIFIIFLYRHATIVKTEITRQINLANERRAILFQIKRSYPKLGNKNIFYITGNKNFYIENLSLPFQQGPGYTLMVWYYDTGVIPPKLLLDNFLWGMTEQGYRESDRSGFGYFWDFEKLKQTVDENDLKSENVYAFFYDGQIGTLEDITIETRVRLQKAIIGQK